MTKESSSEKMMVIFVVFVLALFFFVTMATGLDPIRAAEVIFSPAVIKQTLVIILLALAVLIMSWIGRNFYKIVRRGQKYIKP